MKPIVGITVSNNGPETYQLSALYAQFVARAGGVPVMLTQDVGLIGEYLRVCDGVVLTGGDDIDTRPMGIPLHPKAQLIEPRRQAFEVTFIAAIDGHRDKPVLGVCLGMQLMAIHHGAGLIQHLPDALGEEAAAAHQGNRRHTLVARAGDEGAAHAIQPGGVVVSSHHQAVTGTGRLRVLATAPDGVVEAVDDPARPFYLGVQWHPERGDDGPLSLGLFARLIASCRAAT